MSHDPNLLTFRMHIVIKRLYLYLLLMIGSQIALAQSILTVNDLMGYWTGSFIRNGKSTQLFTLEFRQDGDSLGAVMTIPDWVYYEPTISTVRREGNTVKFDSPYGEIVATLDTSFVEMVGTTGFADVHLKRSLRPPHWPQEMMDTTLQLNGYHARTRITKPAGKGPFPSVIIIHGRGCGGRDSWSQRPQVLARYGLVVITFDKRGHRETGISCTETNLQQHAMDVATLSQIISTLPFVSSVGYLGYSAGGWVAPLAAKLSDIPIQFMATVVGPATSIRQQQLDCCTYYVGDRLGLDERCVLQARDYVNLSYADLPAQEHFSQMQILLDSAKKLGWVDVLEESDIPNTPEEIDKLWVRRNQYDPAEDLMQFEGPFLSILGTNDFVVPYRENRDRFVEIFAQANKTNYTVAIIPNAHHGMEHGHQLRDLGYQKETTSWPTYWKYDRVAPGAFDEIIRFLRHYQIINR